MAPHARRQLGKPKRAKPNNLHGRTGFDPLPNRGEDRVDRAFRRRATHVMPQFSLHDTD